LKPPIHSELDLTKRLEKGLAVAAVQNLQMRVGLTDAETCELIAPRRTLSRREASGQLLSREDADKTVRVARVTARAQQVFGGKPDYAADWLRTTKSALGDRTPMQALLTGSGAQVREPAALAGHRFIKVDIPDEVSRQSVEEAQLPTDWSRRITVTRDWGDRWLREGETAVLVVRSVLVPEMYNVLINPRHADAARIKRLTVMPYPLDSRLTARNPKG
jgi:putative toxin-antitoxin system antitoxin component (TIGR02293 family)